MNLQKIAWRTLRTGRSLVRRTGMVRIRPLRAMAQGAARFTIFKYVLPRTRAPLMIQGHKMYVTGGDSVLFALDMAADQYEPATSDLFRRLLRPGMNVVDIGAHVGYFTLLAAKLVGTEGRVFAFEADPATYNVLRENIELNQYENIVASDKAISDHVGELKLFGSHQRDGDGVSRWNRVYAADQAEQGTTIPAVTLDDFLDAHGDPAVDLLKMDIEGAEVLALRGMSRLLRRSQHPKLILEFYPDGLAAAGSEPLEMPRQLLELGYRISLLSDEGIENVDSPSALLQSVEPGKSVNLFCE
jgi:FkbM family methyltransferase